MQNPDYDHQAGLALSRTVGRLTGLFLSWAASHSVQHPKFIADCQQCRFLDDYSTILREGLTS